MFVPCDGLLLDMDGVLVDSGASIEMIWTAWARGHGFDPAEVIAYSHGVPERFVVAHYLGEDDPAAVDALSARFADRSPEVVPGARLFLECLGLPWAVVTSARRITAQRSFEFTRLPRPDAMVTADDVQRGKPHPDPYLKAAAAIGVDASRCFTLEDAPAGVIAALAAGCTVIGVSTTHSPQSLLDAGATGVIADLRAVSAMPDGVEIALT